MPPKIARLAGLGAFAVSLVLLALIVLFIAAPPLVRGMFFLPSEDGRPRRRRRAARQVQTKGAAA